MSIIHFSGVYGGPAAPPPTPTIANRTVSHADVSAPFDSRAGWRTLANGNSQRGTGSGSLTWANNAGEWISEADDGRYEISATEVSQTGAATRTGTMDTFLACSSTRPWTIVTTTSGLKDWVIDITIREILDTGNSDTARITLLVEGVV